METKTRYHVAWDMTLKDGNVLTTTNINIVFNLVEQNNIVSLYAEHLHSFVNLRDFA